MSQSAITIGLDANEANVKERVGSNVYAFQILKYLNRFQLKKTGFFRSQNLNFHIYLKANPLPDLPKENENWRYHILKPKFLWTQWRLPLELYWQKQKPAVFFSPGHYAPRFCPTPLVISIMDLAFLKYPHQFKKKDLYQLINWTKYSVKKASLILTISEFSKKEIIHFYHYPADKIKVIYPGLENSNYSSSAFKKAFSAARKKFSLNQKYFVFLGTLQPRKNIIRLIKAFKILISQGFDFQLVIVGKKGWLYQKIFQKAKELKLKNKIIFTDFVSKIEKTTILANAFAFILPSLYEGFGIPVLEAMKAGCPIIVSRNSSLPEVSGQAAIYINNPYSVDSIYQAMLKMVKLNQQEKESLIKKGFKQLKKFSWEKSAKEALNQLLLISNK